ncbi:hypothetical protein FTV88_2828 [Heliorestis convoluta]|uniref:Uncharacterized protein n=1 Tax=Heliorestis convoluta TaxID=356322 RepID=A0A5Q2N272_9FIRM|nr:hypothetical protein FTV88_2828 [Heliorestis convoluta]
MPRGKRGKEPFSGKKTGAMRVVPRKLAFVPAEGMKVGFF